MQRIEDAVNGVLEAMRQRGVSEYSLKCIRWSVYRRIVVWHHTHDTDICSYELLSSLCELQRIRYEHGEISRKFYRAFVTAAFRIRSYVDTGKVDFSIVKDTKYYKPGKEYQELVDSILKASGLTEGSQTDISLQSLCVNSFAFSRNAIPVLNKQQTGIFLILSQRLRKRILII